MVLRGVSSSIKQQKIHISGEYLNPHYILHKSLPTITTRTALHAYLLFKMKISIKNYNIKRMSINIAHADNSKTNGLRHSMPFN